MTSEELARIGAMGFYHEDGFAAAWKMAQKFSGKGGRIATLPDIIDARLASTPNDLTWNTWYTTLSAEYVGIGANGRKKIIVAHGVGPMATLDGIMKAYRYEYGDDTRRNRGGRITREEFLRLEAGEYGEVHVIDYNKYVENYQYTFSEILRNRDCQADILLAARLGKRHLEYCAAHAGYAREWHEMQVEVDPINKYGSDNHEQFCERRRERHLINMYNPYILAVNAAANCPYRYLPRLENEDDEAVAHLLSIGRLSNSHHEGNESLVCDVACHEWWNKVRLVGIRPGRNANYIHDGFGDVSRLLRKNWQMVLKPTGSELPVGLRRLLRLPGDALFTEYPKQGARMDTGEPEYPVSSLSEIGTVPFKTTVGGYYGFFKYGLSEVEAIAPPGAAVYEFEGDIEIECVDGDPTYHVGTVKFYAANVNTLMRLPRTASIKNNFGLLAQLASAQ